MPPKNMIKFEDWQGLPLAINGIDKKTKEEDVRWEVSNKLDKDPTDIFLVHKLNTWSDRCASWRSGGPLSFLPVRVLVKDDPLPVMISVSRFTMKTDGKVVSKHKGDVNGATMCTSIASMVPDIAAITGIPQDKLHFRFEFQPVANAETVQLAFWDRLGWRYENNFSLIAYNTEIDDYTEITLKLHCKVILGDGRCVPHTFDGILNFQDKLSVLFQLINHAYMKRYGDKLKIDGGMLSADRCRGWSKLYTLEANGNDLVMDCFYEKDDCITFNGTGSIDEGGFYCDICEHLLKNQKNWEAHQQSRKHALAVARVARAKAKAKASARASWSSDDSADSD